ncbi:unnamed protein product [Sphacelaria rigidula]
MCTTTVIILAKLLGDPETTAVSSVYSIPHTALRTRSRGVSVPLPVSSSRYIMFLKMISPLNRTRAISSAAGKEILNSSGDNSHPCRSALMTSNHSESSPSSLRTRACMPSWNGRMTFTISPGMPARTSTRHKSSRSTESRAFGRSMKHMYSCILRCRSSSWRRRTTNSMSSGSIRSEAALFLGQYFVGFAVMAEVVGHYIQKHLPCARDQCDSPVVVTVGAVRFLVEHFYGCNSEALHTQRPFPMAPWPAPAEVGRGLPAIFTHAKTTEPPTVEQETGEKREPVPRVDVDPQFGR